MSEAIDFYFEFASPYGYFTSTRIDALGARFGCTVTWHPIMLGPIFKETGAMPLMHTPKKGPYMNRDIVRFARFLDVPLTLPAVQPVNSLAPSRACLWLDQIEPGRGKALAAALYRAHWGEGRDIGQAKETAAVAETMGIDPAAVLDGISRPEIKERLRTETEAASRRGVFGSPFVFVGNEPFWGADRLDQIEAWLVRGGF